MATVTVTFVLMHFSCKKSSINNILVTVMLFYHHDSLTTDGYGYGYVANKRMPTLSPREGQVISTSHGLSICLSQG